MDAKAIRAEAQRQVREEQFNEAVVQEKARLKAHRPFWHRLFPFVITITRRS